MPLQRLQTWCFDLKLQMPSFSAQEDVCVVFSSILDEAQIRLAMYELKQSSFSYDVSCEGSLAEISLYLHSSEKMTAATVKTWIFDGRIVGHFHFHALSSLSAGNRWNKVVCPPGSGYHEQFSISHKNKLTV